MTNADAREHQRHDFLIGLIVGGVLGVGAMVLGPRLISGLGGRVAESARALGRKAQGIRDDMCDAVAHGAQKLERRATEAKTDPGARTATLVAAHP